jgi:hypothetical protein
MGMFEYMLEMSRDAKVVLGVIGVCNSWVMRSGELDTMRAFGSG